MSKITFPYISQMQQSTLDRFTAMASETGTHIDAMVNSFGEVSVTETLENGNILRWIIHYDGSSELL